MLFRRKLKAFKVCVQYEYVANEYNVAVVKRNACDVEFAKSKQHLYRKLKKKFKYSNVLSLEIEELN